MGVSRAVVFDLDDTLYLETKYVASGFCAVARQVANRIPLSQEEVFQFLWKRFRAGFRGDHFDRLLEQYPELCTVTHVDELVSTYRSHSPRIDLLAGVSGLINRLESAGIQMAIITDGPVQSQSAKIRALGLDSRIEQRVQTDEWGIEFRKPHPRAYIYVSTKLRVVPGECVFVGDNPKKDFFGARSLGWKTIRLRFSSQLSFQWEPDELSYSADIEVHSLQELSECLNGCCNL